LLRKGRGEERVAKIQDSPGASTAPFTIRRPGRFTKLMHAAFAQIALSAKPRISLQMAALMIQRKSSG
jgi:hypothetical protein